MPDIDVAVAEQNSTIAVYPHHDEALNAWKPLGDGGFASNHVSMVGKGAKRQRSLLGAHHFAPENCHHRAQGDSSYSSGLRRANDLTGGARRDGQHITVEIRRLQRRRRRDHHPARRRPVPHLHHESLAATAIYVDVPLKQRSAAVLRLPSMSQTGHPMGDNNCAATAQLPLFE